MSKHKRSATRKIVAASTIGALAVSGAAFGVFSVANADERDVSAAPKATVNTVTGPLVFKAGSKYLRFNGEAREFYGLGVKEFPTLAAAWSADMPVFTYPGPGETGTITDSAGQCATTGNYLMPNTNMIRARWEACSGPGNQEASQSFTNTAQGMRVNGVVYRNVDKRDYQAHLYDGAGWDKPGYMWAAWKKDSTATAPEVAPSNGNASASAGASATADGNNNPAAVAAAQAAANSDATSIADAASDISANSAAKIAGN